MIDFRQVEPGSALDEFHFAMWTGFLRFMLEKDDVRVEFERETGETLPKMALSGLDIAIDKACGFDREAAQIAYMAKFAAWVTPLYWGGPEDICPAMAAKLAA